MLTNKKDTPFGYYRVTISTDANDPLLPTTDDWLLVLAQLQDRLSFRSLLNTELQSKAIATHIDLLAYSLKTYSIELAVFSVSTTTIRLVAAEATRYAFPNSLARPRIACVIAAANASAQSSGFGASFKLSCTRTISCTCFLSAFP